jgi:hypothetical protein
MASKARLVIELDLTPNEVTAIATAAINNNQTIEEFVESAVMVYSWESFNKEGK